MLDLDTNEIATLELIASRGEHTVFDGSTLHTLYRKGLVRLSIDGWTITALGSFAVDKRATVGEVVEMVA